MFVWVVCGGGWTGLGLSLQDPTPFSRLIANDAHATGRTPPTQFAALVVEVMGRPKEGCTMDAALTALAPLVEVAASEDGTLYYEFFASGAHDGGWCTFSAQSRRVCR